MKNIKNIILNYIKKNAGVSFVEIERLFENNNFNYKGDLTIHNFSPTVIYWYGWNKEAISIIADLQAANEIELQPANVLIYHIDGKILNFPIAKQTREYKDIHWLPAVFNAVKK